MSFSFFHDNTAGKRARIEGSDLLTGLKLAKFGRSRALCLAECLGKGGACRKTGAEGNFRDRHARVGLPLARTGFFVTGLMTFVGNWNELLLAMVFISDDAKKTLPVSLSKFVGPYNTNYSQMFAAIILAIIPTIVVYCCFSNQIVDGLTAGAVKG